MKGPSGSAWRSSTGRCPDVRCFWLPAPFVKAAEPSEYLAAVEGGPSRGPEDLGGLTGLGYRMTPEPVPADGGAVDGDAGALDELGLVVEDHQAGAGADIRRLGGGIEEGLKPMGFWEGVVVEDGQVGPPGHPQPLVDSRREARIVGVPMHPKRKGEARRGPPSLRALVPNHQDLEGTERLGGEGLQALTQPGGLPPRGHHHRDPRILSALHGWISI